MGPMCPRPWSTVSGPLNCRTRSGSRSGGATGGIWLPWASILRCFPLVPFSTPMAGRFAWGNAEGVVFVADLREIQRRVAEVDLGW